MKAWPTLLRTQVLVILAALALGVPSAFAVHNDGVFELDGNVLDDPAVGTGDDWRTLFTCPNDAEPPANQLNCTSSGLGGATSRAYKADVGDVTIFTGGGSKDEKDIPFWRGKDGSVPDKDNLMEAFAAVYNVSGHQRLYFGGSRFANNGDAQIGFWFFQTAVTFDASTGTFSGNHAVGDILVLANFTGGGGTTNVQVLKVTAIDADGNLSFSNLAAGVGSSNIACNPAGPGGVPPADVACAATNGSNTDSLDPDYDDKFNATGAGTYPPVAFFEGGIDLTELGLSGECFPAFLVETRSSQSIDAVLKDFVLKELQSCTATVATEVHISPNHVDQTNQEVPAGSTVHDKASVTTTSGFPPPQGSNGGTVTFRLFHNSTCEPDGEETDVNVLLSNTDPSTAESKDFGPLDPGSYSFQATYNGGSDPLYPDDAVSLCEPFTAGRFSSSINTRLLRVSDGGEFTNMAINLNNTASVDVQDEATVTCDGDTTGDTVTFLRFDNGNCSGTAANDPGEDVALDGTGTALSSIFSLGPDTLSYKVIYNGGSNCTPSEFSKCEPVCALNFTTTQP